MALINNSPNNYPVVDSSKRMERVWYSWLQDFVDAFNGKIDTLTESGEIPQTISDIYLDGSSNVIAATIGEAETNKTVYIKAIDITNAVTVVPDSFRDGTTITFATLNSYSVLKFDGEFWNVFGGNATIT